MGYTTTDLLDSVKIRGAVSSTGALFTTTRLLQLCTDEFREYLLPRVLKVRENYYTWDDDRVLNATGVYRIHSRAVGGKLDDIFLIDATPTPTRRKNLTLLTEGELSDYGGTPGGQPGFFFKRNNIYLVPKDGSGYSYLRQQFFLRPGDFVPTTECAQVTGINTGTKTVTCETVPADWLNTNIFDIVQAQPHFDTLGISLGVSAVTPGASGTLVFDDALPDDLAVGDWICLAGQTCIVQAPPELHPLLYQRVANICLKALGMADKLKAGEEDLTRMEKGSETLITPRVEKEGKKLVNRTGILRRKGGW